MKELLSSNNKIIVNSDIDGVLSGLVLTNVYSGQTLPVIPAQTRPLFFDEELG